MATTRSRAARATTISTAARVTTRSTAVRATTRSWAARATTRSTGDVGNDTFVIATGDGSDTITDFTDGEDVIDLSAISDISGFEDLVITTQGTDAVIDMTDHGGGQITLSNVDVNDLDETDFIFFETTSMDDGI